MDNRILVSIIVPVYNVEKYLERCIKSLISQTYENIEILLIDDGSTDSSGKICDLFDLQYKKIHSYHKCNAGLSDARNYGINIAKGKYLCFVDSDDYVNVKFVEILLKSIVKNNVKISSVGYKKIKNEKQLSGELYDNKYDEIIENELAISYLLNSEKYCNYAWNKMYLSSLFDNIKFPVGRKMEDLGTTYKLFAQCDSISYNDIPLYYYYQRDDSILHNVDSDFFYDKYLMSYERFDFLKDKYPRIKNNDYFMINTLLECYPYINKYNYVDVIADEIINKIDNRNIKKLTVNRKIKFSLFKLNRKLYQEIFARKA